MTTVSSTEGLEGAEWVREPQSGSCSAQNFRSVTQDVFNCVCTKVQQRFGIKITGNSGSVSRDGFTVTWNFDPNAQTAMIKCTQSPWYVACSTINGVIDGIATGCGAVQS